MTAKSDSHPPSRRPAVSKDSVALYPFVRQGLRPRWLTYKLTTPKEQRELWSGVHVRVYWLELPNGSTPAKKEYEKCIDDVEAKAAFKAMDEFLQANQPIPRSRREKVGVVRNVAVWEVKAPWRGRLIGRLICAQGRGSDYFVALALAKKTQKLPSNSIETAKKRIASALDAGGL